MPPALAPVSPNQLFNILVAFGWKLEREDGLNWCLVKDVDAEPIILPKEGDFVALDIMMDTVLVKSGMNLRQYFELRDRFVPKLM